MQQKEFEMMVNKTIEELRHLLIVKGGEYAGSEDRLANFKRGAARVGVNPLQILWIYAAKHIDSLETYIKDQANGQERPRSEPIVGRLHDLINYCFLMEALIAEEDPARKEAEMRVAKNWAAQGAAASGFASLPFPYNEQSRA